MEVGVLNQEVGVQLSLVVPVFNEVEILQTLYTRVAASLDELDRRWELILVDDGSRDGSSAAADALVEADDRVQVIRFKANCGQSAALVAGFEASRGELVAMIDADLQTYPEDLGSLIATVN